MSLAIPMTNISPNTRRRLLGVLARLDSDFEGERSAAGLLATRMLREAGLSWDDLIGAPEALRQRDVAPVGWRVDLALAQRHVSFLRDWEKGFVGSLERRATLTAKQKLVLTEIAANLRVRGRT